MISGTAHAQVRSRDGRAISVPLARVKLVQSRVLADTRIARSEAVMALIRQIPQADSADVILSQFGHFSTGHGASSEGT